MLLSLLKEALSFLIECINRICLKSKTFPLIMYMEGVILHKSQVNNPIDMLTSITIKLLRSREMYTLAIKAILGSLPRSPVYHPKHRVWLQPTLCRLLCLARAATHIMIPFIMLYHMGVLMLPWHSSFLHLIQRHYTAITLLQLMEILLQHMLQPRGELCPKLLMRVSLLTMTSLVIVVALCHGR